MPTAISESIALLRQTLALLGEGKRISILASSDDCDYFRKRYLPPQPARELASPQKAPTPSSKENKPAALAAPPLLPKKEEAAASPPPAPKNALPIPSASNITELHPPSIPLPEGFSLWRQMWPKIGGGSPLLNELPSDELAKKIASRWKTRNQTAPISLLTFSEPKPQKMLLEQIAKAIDAVHGPARLVSAEAIEKEKQWEAFLSVSDLKLIIACDYTLWQLSGLMQFYREIPTQGARFLGNIPLFLLPDLSLYLKDPLLKRSLWKALCQKFSSEKFRL